MLDKIFNLKKRFFKRELHQTEATIWSTEFSRYTTAYEYEKTRQLYSQGQDQLAQVEAQLKTNPQKDIKDKLQGQKDQLTKQLEALKTSLTDLDIMINGTEPNNQYPDGVRGINDKLQAQIKKREHIKEFIKYYC